MRIAITGGAGFIGSHIVDELQAHQHELAIIDNLSRGLESRVPHNVKLFHGDITKPETAAFIESFRPEAVVHLAAQMDVATSVNNPVLDANINVIGTINMLQAAKNSGCKAFIFASSGGAVYGDPAILPATEADTPIAFKAPYGASKYCAELYLDLFERSSSMRHVSLRLSNVYGPRQSDGGEAGVVAIFSKRMLQNLTPTIFGDGLQTRDFVYAGDVARAFRLAIDGDARGAFNISTEEQTSLLDLVGHLKTITGFEGEPHFAPGLPGEVRKSSLSYGAATQALGWKPEMSFFNGLKATVEEQKSSLAAVATLANTQTSAKPTEKLPRCA